MSVPCWCLLPAAPLSALPHQQQGQNITLHSVSERLQWQMEDAAAASPLRQHSESGLTDPSAASTSSSAAMAAAPPPALAASEASCGSSSSSSSLFKRKSHHRSAVRRPGTAASALKDEKPQLTEPQQGDDDDEASSAQALEQTRILQRFRAQQKAAAVSSSLLLSAASASSSASSAAADGRAMIGGRAFHAEVEAKDALEEQRRAFVEAEIERRRKESMGGRQREEEGKREEAAAGDAQRREEAQAAEAAGGDSVDAVLREVAPLLRRKAVLDEKEEESADRWLRGISEVPLPIASEAQQLQAAALTGTLRADTEAELLLSSACCLCLSHRLANIERTEAARLRLQQQRREQRESSSPPPPLLPSNYNSNFAGHKADWDSAMREQWRLQADTRDRQRDDQRTTGSREANRGRGGRETGRGGRGGRDTASDDRVAERFIKRFKSR